MCKIILQTSRSGLGVFDSRFLGCSCLFQLYVKFRVNMKIRYLSPTSLPWPCFLLFLFIFCHSAFSQSAQLSSQVSHEWCMWRLRTCTIARCILSGQYCQTVGCFLEPENLIKIKLFSSFRGNNKLAKNSNIKPLDSKC